MPKRFLSIRLTAEELEEVYEQTKNSTCRSLTEYVKKVLTKKPVTIKTRNQSQDELLAVMVDIRNRLDQLAERGEDKPQEDLLQESTEIRQLTRETFEKFSHGTFEKVG
jgi:hypothetical protein